jgi:peroxiredoxin
VPVKALHWDTAACLRKTGAQSGVSSARDVSWMDDSQSMMTILTAAVALLLATPVKASPPAPGAVVPEFSLNDIHRRARSLGDFNDKRAIVVVFLDTECPVSNLYVLTLIGMHKQFAGKGVQFLAINASGQDSFVSVSAHAQERNVPFPVLKDFDQKVARSFGATRTPEAFLLDAQRVIRYHGRIDDQYGTGLRREKATQHHLQEAIEELLAGKPIGTSQTETSGCLIEGSEKSRPGVEATYAKHVAAILQKHCQGCHRPGEVAPFSLLSYEDARQRSRRIREAVLEQRMPPWHADPRFGKFSNDRRLSDEERDTLIGWIDSGARRGNDKDLPSPLKFVDGWQIGAPERVITMKKEFRVPATGVLDYQRFLVDPEFKQDVWVQAAECRPGNRRVVHHILVYILAPGVLEPYAPDGTAATLVGWAPGDMPARYSPGTARRVAAGSKLLFEVHYTPDGTEQTDRSSVGIIFAKQPPASSVETNILANMFINIPPRAPDYKGQMTFTFRDDATLLSFMPHMHLRGTSARYDLAYPDGKSETLLSVPDYDFNWQSVYRFANPLHVPKGSKLTWTAHWDNSADNPRNPDPAKTVHWGLQTWDEMQNGWMELVWEKTNGRVAELTGTPEARR